MKRREWYTIIVKTRQLLQKIQELYLACLSEQR